LISSLKQIEEQKIVAHGYRSRGKLLEEYKKIVDSSNNITKTDLNGTITYVNDKFAKLSGYSKDELIGQPHNIVRDPDMPASYFERLWQTILAKKVWHGTIKNRNKNGEVYYVETTIAPILDEDDNIIEFISVKNDVTKLIKHKNILQNQIYTDPLTGIPNRIKLKQDLKNLDHLSVILLNINGFKEVNNLFGLYFGDQMLIYIAKILQTICDPINAGFYRISSDEFVILPRTDIDEAGMIAIVHDVVNHLKKNPFEFNSITFDIEFSFGITIGTTNTEKNTVLGMADSALHSARRSNDLYAIYTESEDPQKEYEHNFKWNQKIKKALQDDRIDVYYQPIVSTVDGKVKKYECLVRFIEETGQVVSPYAFLDVAKRSRLYSDITRTVITKACQTFSERKEKFSINLSIEDLLKPETIVFLIEEVQRYRLEEHVIVEILESEGIDNYAVVINVIEQLKSSGIEIAIDDFGTGYSNFAYLVSLDIDTLKIDGSLIKHIDVSLSSRSIVRSIVGFAKELGIKTVAEFVSSEDIYTIVKELGIDFAQGYYFSEPIPRHKLPKV